MAEDDKKTSHDDLDIVEIDQLHNAVLQMSKSCFEYKKICIGLLGAAIALIVKFSPESNHITNTIFIVPLIIVVSFWLADSTAYYYQVATRYRMNKIREDIALRNNIEEYNIKELKLSIFTSLFNGSMILYFTLIFFFIISWCLLLG